MQKTNQWELILEDGKFGFEVKALYVQKLKKPRIIDGYDYQNKYLIKWKWFSGSGKNLYKNEKTFYSEERAKRFYHCIDVNIQALKIS